ncbi:hypothetical protein [Haliangium sp.]|uniref:hypothetical protein n=1 Tax=Haliangium sp. TaxID=2663208 RepID=UPI003D0DDF4C
MSKPWLLIATAVVAALSLFAGTFSVAWWVHDDGALKVDVGLLEARTCQSQAPDEPCATVALGRLVSAPDLRWVRVGTGAYAAAWMAAVLCLAMAGMAAAGKRSGLLSRTALVAVASTLTTGIMFVVWAPVDVARGPSVSMACFLAGAALGLVAVALSLRRPS